MILAPTLVVGALGLLVGLLPSVLFRKLAGLGDTPIERIRAALPKYDCGGCGYATCNSFARAVAEGRASPTGCTPGGPTVAHAIGDILGVSVNVSDALMAVVHCRGGVAEALERGRYDGIADCHAAVLTGNGAKVCVDGCLGLGTCVRACPFSALSVNENLVAVVDEEKCTGCGRCVSVCPRSLISLIPQLHKIFLACSNHDRGARVKKYCTVGCTACALCVRATPSGAISMDNNLPVLDYSTHESFIVAAHKCPSRCFLDLATARPKANIDSKCDGCGKCPPVCPVKAIDGERNQRHVIDKEKCIGCGVCLPVCHTHAITLWGGLGYTAAERTRRTKRQPGR